MEENKNIEKFIKKIMTYDDLSSTSIHFTNTVMAQVEKLDEQKVFEYKPLISKKIWVAIITLVTGYSIYLAFFGKLTKSKWLDNIALDFSLNFLPSFNFSDTTLYATLVVSLLLLIQIVVLKNYFNKRLSI